MPKTVAETIVETLHAAGVRRIYGRCWRLASTASPTPCAASTRSMGARPARGGGRLRRRRRGAPHRQLAVCAGSCGPGNLHLINGLFDCHRSRVPVLAIAAHIPSAEIGGGYFQETHPQKLFRECSHYVELVCTPDQMPRMLETAIRTAIAQRGVVGRGHPGRRRIVSHADRREGRDRSVAAARR